MGHGGIDADDQIHQVTQSRGIGPVLEQIAKVLQAAGKQRLRVVRSNLFLQAVKVKPLRQLREQLGE